MSTFSIGNTLRQLRDDAGLSARDVSNILKHRYCIDMEHNTLYNYEKGRSSPDIDRFLALCMIYNCNDILYTFGYTDKQQNFTPPSREDEQILQKYHSLPPSGRNLILGALGIEKNNLQQKIS